MGSVGVSFEVICLSDAERMPLVPDGVTLIWDRDLTNSTKKVHKGIELMHPESKAVWLISDDVVVSRYAMQMMLSVAIRGRAIVNPYSNSDNNGVYFSDLRAGGRELKANCSLEDIKGIEDEIMNFPPSRSFILRRWWVPFYCTMMPREAWEAVGFLEEKLEYRHNDEDFCLRANEKGFPSVIELGAFALHFGGKTLPKVASQADYDAASDFFRKKWSHTMKHHG